MRYITRGTMCGSPLKSASSLTALRSSAIQGRIDPSRERFYEPIRYSTGGIATAASEIF